jgi:hypothetical protein
MHDQRLTDDVAGALAGIQGAIRILEDQRNLTANIPDLAFRKG